MPKNIKAGFAASGLFPLNPDRVLRSMPAPPAELAIPSADEVKVGSCQQDVEPQTPIMPLLVLGKAKVMSYKDLKEARAKHIVKDAAKEAKGKGKRGRKCKSATLEAEEATADKVKRGRKRKSTVLEPEPEPEDPEPEPNAKMARTSKAPAPSRASVMEIPVIGDEIVPEP
ncbi:hypothetical protein BGZ57DRAFT_942460 [Hyaloscypha finlandica]|nr:hypothetical protein BGZ57DRAFT_942460 [Hyaloscypha finlandica]